MTYFVTGATGFIGRYLVQSLLQRGKGTIYVLVRPSRSASSTSCASSGARRA